VQNTRYRLIIFDLDGTLADTAPDVHKSMNLLRAQYGLQPISLEEAKKAIGPGPDLFVRHLTPEQKNVDMGKVIKHFREIYAQHLLDTTRLFPGMAELLDELAQNGFQLLVVTNKPERFSRQILTGLGVANLFVEILGPEAVDRQKPAPDPILKAMHIAGTDARRTLMVGDTEYDIRAAKAAGVDVCAVGWGYTPVEQLRQYDPDYLIRSPEELLGVLTPAAAEKDISPE